MLSSFLKHQKIRESFWLTLGAAGMLAAIVLGLFTSSEHWLEEKRQSFVNIPASGQFAFIGIDTDSLNHFGVWPWPRSIHAQVIEKINEANPRAIGIDIDFSTMSSPEEDIALAGALAGANGKVVLPMFVQDRSANQERDDLALSAPHPIFAQNSQLATVNILTDDDGVARRFPTSMAINGVEFPSFPALLSGVANDGQSDIHIHYSINPKTIPSYSVHELLSGNVDPKAFEGKTVIYGAQAVELHDNFSVPVHGTLSGTKIQMLAAETLYQDLNIDELDERYVLFVAFIAVAVLLLLTHGCKLKVRLSLLALTALVMEAAALCLFVASTTFLPTISSLGLIAAAATMIGLSELNLQQLSALFEKTGKQNAERLFNRIVDDNVCGIIVIDSRARELERNTTAERFFGAPGTSLPDVLKDQIKSCFPRALFQKDIELNGELSVKSSDGADLILEYVITTSSLEQFDEENRAVTHNQLIACVTLWDVTEKRAQKKKLEHIARYDYLTGVLRRKPFEVAISENLSETIFIVNLHRFKTVNLTLGYEIGDQLLCDAVARVQSLIGDISYACRLTGDKFAFALRQDLTPEECSALCRKIIDGFEEEFKIERARINIGVRVGIATRNGDVDGVTLLSQAEYALDEAGNIQGSHFVVHEVALSDKHRLVRRIENDLWAALEDGQFRMVYQPQVSLKTGTLVGAEALIRWDHPELGFVSPADFIGLAEANGFIDKLGLWVMEQACRDALELPDHMTMAVNVSPAQIMRCDVPEMVRNVLKLTGLPANRLHIEITEEGFLEAKDQVVSDLETLREMGISIALDDFGTGFSSLGYFANFPINKIKVDQMFVRTLEKGDQNEAIIRSVKALSDGLGLKMICEGIETKEQGEILREMGVHEGQGYYYSKPISCDALVEMTTAQTTKATAEKMQRLLKRSYF